MIENLRVRLESDLGAAFPCLAGLLQTRHRNPADVVLLVSLSVAPDLQMQRLGKKVDAGNADAVQAAGDFVSVGVKLSAGVKLGHHHFRRRLSLLLHLVDGNAAAVVDHRDRIVQMDRDFHRVAISRQRLVDRIVDHLVDQMVKTQSRRSNRYTSPGVCALLPGLPGPRSRMNRKPGAFLLVTVVPAVANTFSFITA